MKYFIIENFLSHTIKTSEKIHSIPVKEEELEDIIEKMMPEDSVIREIYTLGKEFYILESKIEEPEVDMLNYDVYSIENFFEHTLIGIESYAKDILKNR